MIQAKHIQKSYGLLTVLIDISFSLERGQKVALVGDNGIGKTTLLKIIAGIEDSDAGKLDIFRDTRIGYLPQDTALIGDETIEQYFRRTADAEVLKHKMEIMLAGFGLENIGLEHKLSDLSSGQKSKVILASILLKGVDLLLLDEPTNNLDLPALIWLEDFLKNSPAACIIISHDRQFLDRIVRKIFELDRNTRMLNISGGTYSKYLETQTNALNREKLEHKLQQEKIERLSSQIRQKHIDADLGAKWMGTDNDKFLRGFKRNRAGKSSRVAKTIEKRIDMMDKLEKPLEREGLEIGLEAKIEPGTLGLYLHDVVGGYKTGFTVGPVSLEIKYGDRVGIIGLNGTGKSTLLKTITGELAPLSGKIEIGSGIKIGNMMQEHQSLPREKTLFEFITERTGLIKKDAYTLLFKFGFDEFQIPKPIGNLSPGGRARLLLALFLAESVNMLILDEPTNHLDMEALEALEETLRMYKGTVLLVSHDRYFIEKADLDDMYTLSDGKLNKVLDYTQYVAEAEKKAERLLKML